MVEKEQAELLHLAAPLLSSMDGSEPKNDYQEILEDRGIAQSVASRVYKINEFQQQIEYQMSDEHDSKPIRQGVRFEPTRENDDGSESEDEYYDAETDYDELDNEDIVKFNPIELTDKEKQRTLFACLLALTIGNMMINNVVSFLPTYIDQKVWKSIDGY